MDIKYTATSGVSWPIKNGGASTIPELLDQPTVEAVIVQHCDGTTERYERPPEPPKRYIVEHRVPVIGDRYLGPEGVVQTATFAYTTTLKKPVIVEELP